MKKLLFILVFLLISSNALADYSCTASSAKVADVQTCISNASSQSGVVTITIPPGTETWASNLSINMASGFANVTSLILSGSGESTSITMSAAKIDIVSAPGKKWRITNMKLLGTGPTYQGIIYVSGRTRPSDNPSAGYSIDNIIWDLTAAKTRAIYFTDSSYGVIYNNIGSSGDQFASFEDRRGDAYGNTSWDEGAALGSQDANYLEYNNLTYQYISVEYIMMFADGARGARVVARYNTLTNYYLGGHDFSSNYRGILQYEAYNNSITSTINFYTPPINFRGGTGVLYNNYFYHNVAQTYKNYANSGASPIMFRNARDTTAYTFGICGSTDIKAYLGAGATSWGTCTSGSTCMDIDGGTGTAYPCRDQIGTGDNLSPQSSKPFLVWNNTVKLSTDDVVNATVYSASANIVADRDYCYHSTTMPASCNGVETTYTQYTCPHPLADPSAQGACASGTAGVLGYTLTGGGSDTTAPTVTSAYIQANGTDVIFNFSEPITSTSGAAFTAAGLGSAVTLTCPAVGTAATSITCTTNRPITQEEGNGTYGYTGTKVVDVATNALATIDSSPTLVNLSAQNTPPTYTVTINKTGTGCTITSSPSGANCGETCSVTVDGGTLVTIGGYLENGWSSITYGGDCASNGTVTVNADKTCTVTCTPIYLLN